MMASYLAAIEKGKLAENQAGLACAEGEMLNHSHSAEDSVQDGSIAGMDRSPIPILRPLPEDIREHLLRLDAQDRHLRFGRAVSDEYLHRYADQLSAAVATIVGYLSDGRLCAMAELRAVADGDDAAGEVALSVDRRYRGEGLGSGLFAMTIGLAKARGFRRLRVHCSAANKPMCAIAQAHATGRERTGPDITYRFEIHNPASAPDLGAFDPMEKQSCLA